MASSRAASSGTRRRRRTTPLRATSMIGCSAATTNWRSTSSRHSMSRAVTPRRPLCARCRGTSSPSFSNADNRFVSDLMTFKRTDKYVRQARSVAQQPSIERIVREKGEQNNSRQRDLTLKARALVCDARLFVRGEEIEVRSEDAAGPDRACVPDPCRQGPRQSRHAAWRCIFRERDRSVPRARQRRHVRRGWNRSYRGRAGDSQLRAVERAQRNQDDGKGRRRAV